MSARIIGLDEIHAARDELFGSGMMLYTTERRRSLRKLSKACSGIALGFAPLGWDTPHGVLLSQRSICLHCGHTVATRQPTWMSKHAWEKHNVEQYSPGSAGHELLFEGF